ncbi:MAG: glycine--tRNA ligase subunit beta [Porticoccaceae bacterium]|nr:glycine--tRNA ligase subunit beta [Porticoccaceae bacterium]
MSKDLLVEIGTEELPPKSLNNLMNAFTLGFEAQLQQAKLTHTAIKGFATPRRLALLVSDLSEQQADSAIEKLGPAVKAAFDADGVPSKAAQGFARGCGVSVEELETTDTDKGERLVFRKIQTGETTASLLPGLIELCLADLPIAKRMRWGASRVEFVRPVKWVLMVYGDEVIPAQIMGLSASRQSRGHRFHHPEAVTINKAGDYVEILRQCHVIADFCERRELIRAGVEAEATKHGGEAVIDAALLDEVTALNEWPVALSGRFDERFLAVPAQALISSMKEHQKYFHVVNDDKQLLPVFITVANIDSKDPGSVIAGNERVIRPRLADAAFFYETDLKTPLITQREKLRNIVFQEKLGSVFDKTERVAQLAEYLATQTGANSEQSKLAAQLSKSDLLSEMVQEFPDLQGIMGKHYALAEQLDPAVASALSEQYLPRFSGDELPQSKVGITLALADRLDTLVGIFAIGQAPTGSSDPFALRRASLAVLRILVDHEINLDLSAALSQAAKCYTTLSVPSASVEQVFTYLIGRFNAWFEGGDISTEAIQAVTVKQLTNPVDIVQRIKAVADFAKQAEAPALASANKRVANILSKQGGIDTQINLDPALLVAPEEQALAQAINKLSTPLGALLNDRNYAAALALLASLRNPVDAFFDEVMVIVEDEKLRANRLALLNQLRGLFLGIADISLLAASK